MRWKDERGGTGWEESVLDELLMKILMNAANQTCVPFWNRWFVLAYLFCVGNLIRLQFTPQGVCTDIEQAGGLQFVFTSVPVNIQDMGFFHGGKRNDAVAGRQWFCRMLH